MKQPDIHRVIAFNQLLLEFRAINRRVHIPPKNTQPENDAEHSYSLAMMAWYLAQHFPHIDTDKAIRLALVHDLVEIYAGDTFAYGNKAELDSKQEREMAALKRLRQEWPDFPELFLDVQECEDLASEEAKFVYALDKLMPAIMNYLGDGYVWHKHGVTFEMFVAEKEKKIPISPDVYAYYKELLKLLNAKPHIFPAKKQS